MLTKEQKRQQSEELRGVLTEVNTLFLMDNTGLKVNEVNQLRSQVRQSEATYKVVKNSVVKLALEGTELEGLTPFLVGPKALAYTSGDAVALAKVLREFIKQHPELSFQRAYLEGQILEGAEAEKIADMPSKEELLTKLVYLLQSPIRRLAVALNTPAQNLASVLGQVAEKKEQGDEGAAETAVEVTSEEPAEEAAEATAEATADETAEAAAEESVEEATEEAADDVAESATEETADMATEEAADDVAESTTEETADMATEETTDVDAEDPGDDSNEESKDS